MNKKELNELKRQYNVEKSNITSIYGCYVNSAGEIVARMDYAVSMLKEEEVVVYLDRLKKVLGGTPGKNLIDIEFTTEQVAGSEEHKLLNTLRTSNCADEEAREALYEKIIPNLNLSDSNYVIILAPNSYDVPSKGSDDELFREASDEVFRYFVCAICPVKDSGADLKFFYDQKEFHISANGAVVGKTEVGFMFPTFDDRSTNLYNALYFLRKPDEVHQELIDALFKPEETGIVPIQKDSFNELLSETLGSDYSFEVAQAVHEQLNERIEQHKEESDSEPLNLDSKDIERILKESRVPAHQIDSFIEAVEEQYGEDPDYLPENLVSKKFEIATPDVKISAESEFASLIETKEINGKKCIVIPIRDEMTVNGVTVGIG